MIPERHEDWLRCATEDRNHYVIGKDGSVQYVPPFENPISRWIKRRREYSNLERVITEYDQEFSSKSIDGFSCMLFPGFARSYLNRLNSLSCLDIQRSDLSKRKKQRLNSLIKDAYLKYEIANARNNTLLEDLKNQEYLT